MSPPLSINKQTLYPSLKGLMVIQGAFCSIRKKTSIVQCISRLVMCECTGKFCLLDLNKVISIHLILTDTYIEGQCLCPTSISYGLSPFEQQSVKDPHRLNKVVSTYFV